MLVHTKSSFFHQPNPHLFYEVWWQTVLEKCGSGLSFLKERAMCHQSHRPHGSSQRGWKLRRQGRDDGEGESLLSGLTGGQATVTASRYQK